jgi:uncharacterized protein
MSNGVLIVLAAAALITSIISAILGMAGGVLLLAVMLSFLPHAEAIPTHAATQIASNGTRVIVFIGNVDWRTFFRFCLGVIPGGAIGIYLLWATGPAEESEPYLKMLIGVYILVATFLPAPAKDRTLAMKWWDFPLLGLAAGAAALTVGAVGPMIAPLFARRNFVKERLIATKATCQMATHIIKIPAFLFVRELDVARLGVLSLLLIAMVIPGTLIGKRILTHVPEHWFIIAYRVALTFAGLKVLIVDGVWAVLAP